MVKTQSIWSSTDSRRFQVTGIRQDNQDTWIHYANIQTGTEYQCLVDAFIQRFREAPNDGH